MLSALWVHCACGVIVCAVGVSPEELMEKADEVKNQL